MMEVSAEVAELLSQLERIEESLPKVFDAPFM
jgi:hypothetical protein